MTTEFLRNLPDGVTYNPLGEEGYKKQSKKEAKNPDIVTVGDFMFNIEIVSKTALISLRKFLPSEEYRLLKNRKSARLCRQKRKTERGSMKKSLEEVEAEM